VALIALIVLVTGLTGAVLGGLAWLEKRAGARALTDTAMAQVAGLTAEHAAQFFGDTEPAVRLGPLLVAQGTLDPADLAGLERYLLSMVRAHPALTWASYGDRNDRFVGAWRDQAGALFINRSFPRNGRIRLEEERVDGDGRRALVRVVEDHRYYPRERPYWAVAQGHRDVAWTHAYKFFDGAMGITCVAPLRDAGGSLRGVFTVDFSLHRLSQFLTSFRVTPRSRAYITTLEGDVLAGPIADGGRGPTGGDEARFVAAVVRRAANGQTLAANGAERTLGRTASFKVGDHEWRVVAVVPERDFTERIDAQARRAAILGGVGLLVATGAGIALAGWIARPLRTLGAQARRIRDGDLDVLIVPSSRDEIGTLAGTMADMVKGLRDRDFIRACSDAT
jgi:HAMP domain-containing protein